MADSNSTPPALPYVGLRPYETEERDLFFGRDGEARLLGNKVLSTSLTLFYGPSGVGKSSVLRALVIPQLEEDEAVVAYFDSWAAERPVERLKAYLGGVLEARGIAHPLAASPTLLELLRLLSHVSKKTPVLILDQFEELLVNHPEELDAFGREIATVVRGAAVEAHLVLSLREEFLAALEPLRQHIVTLFQSTFRLAELQGDAVREAIVRPVAARDFRGSYEAAVVDRLLHELSGLPVLQLVCLRLWQAASARGTSLVTLALYEQLGGTDRVLADYVQEVMQAGRSHTNTAEMIRFLAPPSGLKISYTCADLMSHTGLDEQVIQAELDRLSDARILRPRTFGTSRRYELQHDALVKLLRPWAEDVRQKDRERLQREQERSKTRRKIVLAVVSGAVLVVVGGAVGLYKWNVAKTMKEAEHAAEIQRQKDIATFAQNQIAENTTNRFEALRSLQVNDFKKYQKDASQIFDNATVYLLWQEQNVQLDDADLQKLEHLLSIRGLPAGELESPDRRQRFLAFAALAKLLEENEDLLPAQYGVDTAGIDAVQLVDEWSEWPLRLEYPAGRKLNANAFGLYWQSLSQELARMWGIPTPRKMRVSEAPTLAARKLAMRSSDEVHSVLREFPDVDTKLWLNSEGLPDEALDFLEYFIDPADKTRVEIGAAEYWLVPRWTAPVWKVSGHLASRSEAYFAVQLARDILVQQPGLLLTQPVVDGLLDRLAQAHPHTVQQARATRGTMLRDDLIEVVLRQRSLVYLPVLLDALAQYPAEVESKAAVEGVLRDIDGFAPSTFAISGSLGIGESVPLFGPDTAFFGSSYHDTLDALPNPYAPMLRIRLGEEVADLLAKKDLLTPRTEEVVENVRVEFVRRYGMPLIGATFQLDTESLESHEVRVEVLDIERDASASLLLDPAQLDSFYKQLEQELLSQTTMHRVRLLTVEQVDSELESMPEKLSHWLLQEYSLTDIKGILRAVVTPEPAELEYFDNPAGTRVEAPQAHTIAHTQWLLGSLVFWTALDGKVTTRALGDRLRELQAARMQPPTSSISDDTRKDDTRKRLTKAVGLLDRGKVEAAAREFAAAIAQDRDGAKQAFLLEYVALLGRQIEAQLETSCSSRAPGELANSRWLSPEMLAVLEQRDRDTTDPAIWICLLSSRSTREQSPGRLAQLVRLASSSPAFDTWSPNQAGEFAIQGLMSYEYAGEPSDAVIGALRAAWRSANERWDASEAHKAHDDLRDWCQVRKLPRLCQPLLEISVTHAHEDPYDPLALAVEYSGLEADKCDIVKSLLDRSVENSSDDVRPVIEQFRDIIHAQCLANQVSGGDGSRRSSADAAFEALLGRPEDTWQPGNLRWAQSSAMDYYGHVSEYDRAQRLLTKLLADEPDDVDYLVGQLWLSVYREDPPEQLRRTLDALEAKHPKDSASLFARSLIEMILLSDKADAVVREFLLTEHENRSYVALIFAMMPNPDEQVHAAALELLVRLDAEGDSQTWPHRLAVGDVTAWREMLVAHCLGKLSKDELLASVENDEAFARSPLRYLDIPRRALATEAYFYVALRQHNDGEREASKANLQRVVKLGYVRYLEFHLAKQLLVGRWDNL
jgi:hypothetical protein